MGGERASKTRQRERGDICAFCSSIFPAPAERPGERLCTWCAPNSPIHRVLMQFQLVTEGWYVTFLERDCKTSLACRRTYLNEKLLLEAARRGGAELASDPADDLAHAIETGRGAIWLNLTHRQYLALARSR